MSCHFKRMRAAVLAGASILCLGAVVPAAAQTGAKAGASTEDAKPPEKKDQTTAEIVNAQGEVERVLITGRLEEMLPQQLSQYGTRIDIVTAVEIQNGGYLDITQSLQNLVPGLFIANQNGPFDYVDVSFQGSRTQDILWLVDGVRINNRLYAGTTPLDTLPASMVERIEVLDGAQSLFYGTQAISGAINVVTKQFTQDPNGHVSAGFDTNGGRHVDGFFSDTLGGHRIVVFGSTDKSDGFQPFPDEDYPPDATNRSRAYDVLTLGGKYAYDFSNALRFSTSYQHTDAKLDFARALGAPVGFNERREDTLSAKVDYTPSDEIGFFIKGYYHWWYTYFTEFDADLDNPGTLIEVSNHEFWGFTDYGVNALAKYSPTGLGFEFYAGYDYQSYEGSDVVLFIAEHSENVHAVFGEVATTTDLLPNVRLSAGFRHNMPSFGESATVWNVGARWDITPALFVRGAAGTAFRLPTAEELFASDPPGAPNWVGNPNLKPERSTNINASVGGTIGDNLFNWEVIGFWRDVEDLIDTVFIEDLDADVFDNLPDTVEVRGVEAVIGANINQNFSGQLSFTFSSAEMEGVQIQRVPEQYGSLSLDYHPMDLPFGINVAARYVGDVYRSLGDDLGPVEYGGYVVIDLGVRAFLDAERHHRLDFNGHNLFDKEYSTRIDRRVSGDEVPFVLNSLGWPRTFLFRYTYSFF